MIWSAPRIFEGETVCILAGGPSLRGFDATLLAGLRVITVNDAWRIRPTAAVMYFCDGSWWQDQVKRNPKSLDGSRYFTDTIYRNLWVKGDVAGEFADHPQVHTLKLSGQRGFDPDPSALRHGSNSGYQAIHLAVHLGAKRIILLGFDMHVRPDATHWHQEERVANFAQVLKLSMLPHFDTLVRPLAERGIEVLNATPGSALECWPKVTLAQALDKETSWLPTLQQT